VGLSFKTRQLVLGEILELWRWLDQNTSKIKDLTEGGQRHQLLEIIRFSACRIHFGKDQRDLAVYAKLKWG
jgi:hypothetical protein